MSAALQMLFNDREEKVRAGRKSAATVKFYRSKAGHLVRLFELDENGVQCGFPLRRIVDSQPVDRYITKRRSEGAGDGTIDKELVTLRAALKIAKRKGLWKGDIQAIIPSGFAPAYEPRERFLEIEEVSKLLAKLEPDRAARVAFAIATGANLGETDRARREHIKPDVVWIDGTKRKTRRRDVPIVADWQKQLIEHAKEHALGTGGALFTSWGKVDRDLKAACKRAGIEPCSTNDLRRTFAQWMHAQGVQLDILAPMMGHKDTTMLSRVYARLPTPDLARRVRAALGMPEPDCSTVAAKQADAAGQNGRIGRVASKKRRKNAGNLDGPCGNRTHDLGIKNLVLFLPKPKESSRKRREAGRPAAQLQQNSPALSSTSPRGAKGGRR